MATASGSREPRAGWLSHQTSIYGWQSNNGAANIDVIEIPLRGFSRNISRLVANENTEWEELQRRLLAELIDDEAQQVCRWFYVLQNTLRKNHRGSERRSNARPPDGESEQTSNTLPGKKDLIDSVRKALPEFEGFIQSQDWRINHDNPPNISRHTTLCEFLLHGPSVQGGVFEGPAWFDYCRAVKVLLSNPRSRRWLDEGLETFLIADQLKGVVESDAIPEQTRAGPRGQFDEEAHIELDPERVRNFTGYWTLHNFLAFVSGFFVSSSIPAPRSTQNTLHQQNLPSHQQDDDPIRGSRPFRALARVYTLLYTPLATTVCILNITTALGYVMLMNDPSLPQHWYIVITLLTWFLTAAIMIIHGIFATGSMKDYARRLVILAMFTCFVVAVVFHFAGASDFASSFLVGITMAILLLQLW